MTSALEGGECSAARPGRTLPTGKTRYPLYRRLGGPQGRSGQARKISPPPGFDPRTVQPVVSRCTDWATRPTYETGSGVPRRTWEGSTPPPRNSKVLTKLSRNSLKVPKIKKILLYEKKFLVPNYSCLQNPWLGGYRPHISVLSVLCPQLNLLTPPLEKKFLGTPLETGLTYNW
jgi:hypothetical protein